MPAKQKDRVFEAADRLGYLRQRVRDMESVRFQQETTLAEAQAVANLKTEDEGRNQTRQQEIANAEASLAETQAKLDLLYPLLDEAEKSAKTASKTPTE